MDKIIGILEEINPEGNFRDSNNFITDGLLDSLGIVLLVGTIEKEYGIKISGKDIVPANFSCCEALLSLIEGYTS